jgi:hypothetical protein
MRRTIHLILLGVTPLLLTGCIAYAVGTTARPVPKGEFHPNLSVYFVPNGIEDTSEDSGTNDSLAYASADFEGRWGLSDKSDLGLHVPPGGVIVNYKRVLNRVNDPERSAVAVMGGAGIVNWGNHAYFEVGLVTSGREDEHVPYGGIRVMQVLPLNSTAVSDTPTAGIFGGIRYRVNASFSVSPELGVYYDESALEIRKRNFVVIPSISFHWN